MSVPTYPAGESLHIRVKLNGNRGKIAFFNYALEKLDLDWPLGPGRISRNGRLNQEPICTQCGGWIWRRPNLTLDKVYAFARQVAADKAKGGLKLRLRKVLTESECRATHPVTKPVELVKVADAV